jgi:hypothetical protein
MDYVEVVGSALTVAAWGRKEAVENRAFGIGSSIAFLGIGPLLETRPMVDTELVLLPLNSFRLWQQLGAPGKAPPSARLRESAREHRRG